MTTVLASILVFCVIAYATTGVLALRTAAPARLGGRLALACLFQCAWAIVVVVNATRVLLPTSLLVLADVCRGLAWIALLLVPLLPPRGAPARRNLALAASALPALTLAGALASPRIAAVIEFELQRWSGLALAISGLVVVEQFARNLRKEAQWALKPLVLSMGLLFAVELIVWSVALLVGHIPAELWLARAVVNLLIAGLLWIGLRRLSHRQGLELRGERAYFFNSTLALAGVYVLLMSAASWWVSAGRSISSSLVTSVFSAAALVLLTVAVFSEQFRAWLRVTVAKSLQRYRYDYRDEWQKLTAALEEGGDGTVHERLVRLVGGLVNSPNGALWIRDESGFRLSCSTLHGATPQTIERDPFFDELVRHAWILDLDAERAGDLDVRRERGITSPCPAWLLARQDGWLLIPLGSDAQLVGLMLVGRPLAATPLGWEQLDVLRLGSRQAAGHLALEQAAAKLAEMHQFEALNRLSAFVMHDLRHLVAQLDLVVRNAARHRNNPEFIDDAISTIESSVQRMNGLMETLRQGTSAPQERRVDVGDLLAEVVAHCSKRRPTPSVERPSHPVAVMAGRDRLLQAIEHLVRNAQDATPDDGVITLRVRQESQQVEIEIEDTGVGMEPEFVRTRLFKPFDSTKGEQGMGLGAYEARDIVRKLGGELHVDTAPGAGCRIRIQLPAAPRLEAHSPA